MKLRIAAAVAPLLLLTACTADVSPEGRPPETAAAAPAQPTAEVPFNAAAYMEEALAHIEADALFIRDIDWAAVRADALDRTSGATVPEETHGVLREVLTQAGGRHSSLRQPLNNAAYSYIATPEVEAAGPGIAVVTVPGFRSPRPEHVGEYAAAGTDGILAAAKDASCGWIVDLRRNGGGNMGPMLGALSPLLPDGMLMQFIDRDGQAEEVVLGDARVFLDAEELAPAAAAKDTGKPVAVLQSDGTASSAEAVLLSLSTVPDVRTFGAPTAGLATSNVVRTLSDGTALRITQSHMATAAGEIVSGGPLEPDVATEDALGAATDWLRGMCGSGR